MASNPACVSDPAPLPAALDAEIDEVLDLLPVAVALPEVADRLFERLVAALALAVVHDVRARHRAGVTSRTEYLVEAHQVVSQLRQRDLLPRP